jgi:thiamine pyrophosphokinase
LLDLIAIENKKNSIFIEIFCGLGGRRDHELANIYEAERFLSLLPHGGICYFNSGLILSSLSFKVTNLNEKNFSIFYKKKSLSSHSSVEIRGAKYSGNFKLQRPSHGLSNQGLNNMISVHPKNCLVSLYF